MVGEAEHSVPRNIRILFLHLHRSTCTFSVTIACNRLNFILVNYSNNLSITNTVFNEMYSTYCGHNFENAVKSLRISRKFLTANLPGSFRIRTLSTQKNWVQISCKFLTRNLSESFKFGTLSIEKIW